MARSSLKFPLLGGSLLVLGGLAAWVLLDTGPTPAAEPGVLPLAARAGAPETPVFDKSLGGGATAPAQSLDASPLPFAGAPSPAAAAAGPTSAKAAPAPRESAEFSGRVVDESGRPVEGASVSYHAEPLTFVFARHRDETDKPAVAKPAATTTDRNGRFTLTGELPPPPLVGEPEFLPGLQPQLAVRHEVFATLTEPLAGLVAGPRDLGDIVLESGAWIVGRVVDSNGRPIKDAQVRARDGGSGSRGRGPGLPFGAGLAESLDQVTTAADGRFRVNGLRAGKATLTATRSGMRLAALSDLVLEARRPLDVGDVVLEEGASIAGVIVDEQGAPIADADVSVSSMARIMVNRLEDLPRQQIGQEFGQHARSDSEGHFEIGGLAGGTYTVHVSAPGLAELSQQDVPAGTRNLKLQPVRLGSLLITLLDSRSGQPIAGAKLRATAVQGEVLWRMAEDLTVLSGVEAVTAAGVADPPDGSYLVQGAGLDGTDLVLAADGYARQKATGPAVRSAALGRITLSLVPESVVAGVVRDDQQQPIGGALVELSAYVPPEEDRGGFGHFEMRRAVRIGDEEGEDEPLSAERLTARTGDDGVFELRGAAAGEWTLRARADDFVTGDLQRLTLGEGQSQRDMLLTLLQAGSLTGLVAEADGSPAPDVEIMVAPAAAAAPADDGDDPERQIRRRFDRMFGPRDGSDDGERSARTGQDGRYRITGMPAGDYTAQLGSGPRRGQDFGGAMVFFADGGGEPSPQAPLMAVRITAGQEAHADFVRPRRGVVNGRVLAAGVPVEGVSVSLSRSGGPQFFGGPFRGGERRTSDARGEFRFEDVEAGEYEVSAVVPGAPLEKHVPVEVGVGADVRADLLFTGSTLSGRVVDAESGAGVADARISLSPQVEQSSGGGPQPQAFALQIVTGDSSGGPPGGFDMTVGGSFANVRSGEDGRFELKFVEPGKYTIETSGGGYMDASAGPFTIAEGENKDDVALAVSRGAVVEGYVRSGSTGQSIDKVPVRLQSAGEARMNVTENGGRYRFEGLQPGKYTVEVLGSTFGDDETIASESVELQAGQSRTVDLTTKS